MSLEALTPRIAALVAATADRWGLSRELLAALVMQESAGNPNATSPAGAVGLAQLMPATARELLEKWGTWTGGSLEELRETLKDPALNLELGAAYLAQQLAAFGSTELALAAYNAGPGRVAREVGQYGGTWTAIAGHLPAETREYVKRITAALELTHAAADGFPWLGFGAILGSLTFAGWYVSRLTRRR